MTAAPPVTWWGAGGAPFTADTPSTLHDGERRWPVVADIPWLRAGRDEVRERAVAALDAGDADSATVVLLADAGLALPAAASLALNLALGLGAAAGGILLGRAFAAPRPEAPDEPGSSSNGARALPEAVS